MSPRAIRRAAERKQQKELRKQERAAATTAQSHSISDARLAANRANAQLSTGPTSPEGKSKSSLNAVKTGLTGRTVLLPSDDATAYQQFVQRFFALWNPATEAERALVQSLADTEWRLDRIPSLEMGVYAVGRIEFANLFDDHDPALRPALIEAHTYLAYHRQLNNLSIQESRLRRQREKDTAALKQLQSERQSRASGRTAQPANFNAAAPTNGFEFSTSEEFASAHPFSAHFPTTSDPNTALSTHAMQP